jgi:hypothetical protein
MGLKVERGRVYMGGKRCELYRGNLEKQQMFNTIGVKVCILFTQRFKGYIIHSNIINWSTKSQ